MLKSLIEKLPVPTILHKENGEIIYTNDSFKLFFGTCAPSGENIFLIAADPQVRGACEKAIQSESMQGVELPLNLGGSDYLIQYLALPLKENLVASLLINDTLRINSLIAHVRQLRKSAYDHTWILSNNSIPEVIWSNTAQDKPNENLGMTAEELVYVDDVPKIRKCFDQARKTPGKLTSVAVRPAETPDQTIDVDIIYYPNLYFYGHFVASSHARHPGSNAILSRLKNAFMVETDSELAEVLDVPPSAITRAKKQKMPPFSWLEKAFSTKGVSMDWLLGVRGSKFIDQ